MALTIEAFSLLPNLTGGLLRHGAEYALAPKLHSPGIAKPDDYGGGTRDDFASKMRAAPVAMHSIRVKYEQGQAVLMVHDLSGILIYQQPPKGALELIRQRQTSISGLSEWV